jgi:hypothetical protein
MTAGIERRPIAGTRAAGRPAALAGLLTGALLIGGVIGIVAKSEVDALTAPAVASVARSLSSSPSELVREAQVAVGRGPLARDPGAGGGRTLGIAGSTGGAGSTDRQVPIRREHGPTR